MTNARIIDATVLRDSVIGGVHVRVIKVVWDDGGIGYEVWRYDTTPVTDLTENCSFDEEPSDELIAALLFPAQWSCPGCGTSYDESDADMVIVHVNNCDLVDGAGQPVANRPPS